MNVEDLLESLKKAVGRHDDEIDDFHAEVEELREENQRLRERVDAIETAVTLDPTDEPFHELTAEERAVAVRIHAARKAAARGGRGRIVPDDVHSLFDFAIGDGTPYKLMKRAARYDRDSAISHEPGFTYEELAGQAGLSCSVDAIADARVVHAVTTGTGGTAHS